MATKELIAEIRAAASSLTTAADAAENGDVIAAVNGIEDALFRTESILGRLQQLDPTERENDEIRPFATGAPSDAQE